eukprot:gb/GFBE01002198.1/.p1 GENE.gb/GFBE01002198.1/~~gb/GFBE01002198.1/.p1  ORF type:complete len:560 (+),score=104.84 gb/GFBE01002198.1/:1-1680(+)
MLTDTPVELKVQQNLGRQHVSGGHQMRPGRSMSRLPNQMVQQWPQLRRVVHEVSESHAFEVFIGAVIVFNTVLIVVETNANALCRAEGSSCQVAWIEYVNLGLLGIYTLEAIMRLFALRQHILRRGWEMFDLIIVVLSYVDVMLTAASASALPGVQLLRIFRVARLLRAARILRVFPELNSMLQGFISAMSAMVWGLLLIMVLLLMWSVLAVEFLQPFSLEVFEEDSYCHRSFNSVSDAMLLLFQTLVAGDSWGACSIDIVKHAPITSVIFAISLVMIQLGLTNLILAVVVEKAAEAHEADIERKLRQMAKDREEAEVRLTELCRDIDDNQDGVISYEELMHYFDMSDELRNVLMALDIHREDVSQLFSLMDSDGSGDLTYHELVNCIHRSDTNDLKRQVMVLKLQMQDVWTRIRTQMQGNMESMAKNIEDLLGHVESMVSQAQETSGKREEDFLAKVEQITHSLPEADKQSADASRDCLQNEEPPSIAAVPDMGDVDLEMNRIRKQLDVELTQLAASIRTRHDLLHQQVRASNGFPLSNRSMGKSHADESFRGAVSRV